MPRRKTMNVSLTPELEAYVTDRVASGRYRSNSEVLRAAIRLLQDQEVSEAVPRSDAMPAGVQFAQQPLDGSDRDAG